MSDAEAILKQCARTLGVKNFSVGSSASRDALVLAVEQLMARKEWLVQELERAKVYFALGEDGELP